MSKPRYNWWPFVLAMIRDYPERRAAYRELHQQKTTANLSGMPGAGSAARTTEGIALRQLPAQEQREFDAVYAAIRKTKTMREAELRLRVVQLTLWRGFTIRDAALTAHTSESTAKRYRWEFAMLVGHTYGFMTEDECFAAIKKAAGR